MIKLLLAEEYLKNFNDIVTNRNPMTSSSDNLSALMVSHNRKFFIGSSFLYSNDLFILQII